MYASQKAVRTSFPDTEVSSGLIEQNKLINKLCILLKIDSKMAQNYFGVTLHLKEMFRLRKSLYSRHKVIKLFKILIQIVDNMMEIEQKVLCFHGFGTNSDVLSYQLRQFKKEFTSMEFITLNGSIPVDRNVIMDENVVKMIENQNIYSWVNFLKFKNDDQINVFNPGLEEIVKVLKEQGPFFGVMGFSQGSSVAVALALLIEMKKIDLGYQLQCFIFVSAMASQLPYDQQLQCKTPSLHLIGLNDFVVDRSIGLSVQFLNPYVIYHNQGHKVPTLTYEQIKQLKKFFNNPVQDWQQQVFAPKL